MHVDPVVATWQKSSFCNGASSCVEIGEGENGNVLVRNSADLEGPVLVFTPSEWKAFLAGAKNGEFDYA